MTDPTGTTGTTSTTAGTTQNGTTGTPALGASTSGPVSHIARLKNKSMDDIITRWASDLSKYQAEFKDQAGRVASWDRSLVDNGEKIQKLYLNTFEAERASHEIERQLSAVESQQDELEAWLTRYENEVQELFTRQMGQGESLAGPDQERERTYKLAEKLMQHLEEKSRDLAKMVKEINDISGTLSKGNKTEDPVSTLLLYRSPIFVNVMISQLSQIVRVLNGHLAQLQWIDENASALQAKVAAVQKANTSLGSQYGTPETDTSESFYRSYTGRR
jgi:nuclear pore complex protein Nup62